MRRISGFGLCVLTVVMAACSDGPPRNAVSGPGAATGPLRTLMDVATGLEVTSGQVGTFNWVGQSFVVAESGSFTDLRFNLYNFQKGPVAFGNLYLLTQEYLGVPGGLSSSTPGFLARSESTAEGIYAFASSVVINGGTKYWVYTDAQGSFAGSFDADISLAAICT